MGTSVWIVFQTLYSCLDSIFVAAKIDNAVFLLLATTLMAAGNTGKTDRCVRESPSGPEDRPITVAALAVTSASEARRARLLALAVGAATTVAEPPTAPVLAVAPAMSQPLEPLMR